MKRHYYVIMTSTCTHHALNQTSKPQIMHITLVRIGLLYTHAFNFSKHAISLSCPITNL